MPYLIDGHNLIPHLPGLSLTDLDDENALLALLQRFSSQDRSRVEVFFDQAAAGGAGSRRFGQVWAHFASQESSADRAIGRRLASLKKEAKNWTVVSSDREIQAEARAAGARVLAAAEFAPRLSAARATANPSPEEGAEPPVSQAEVEYWLEQFTGDEGRPGDSQ